MAYSNGLTPTGVKPVGVHTPAMLEGTPATVAQQVANHWTDAQREELVHLLLHGMFAGVAGSHVFFADDARRTAEFAIRYAGPPITEVVIDNSNLSPAAIAAIAKMNAG